LSGIISKTTSKIPGNSFGNPVKSGGELQYGNKVSQNTFKNTPDTFCDIISDIISYLTSKFRPDFLVLRKLLDRTGPHFDEHYLLLFVFDMFFDVLL
jgi:hypothetical protein